MKDKVTLLVVCLFIGMLHVSNYENVKASEIGVLNSQVVKEEDGNLDLQISNHYDETMVKKSEKNGNDITFTFFDETTITVHNYKNDFDTEQFDFEIIEQYSFLSFRAGGNINFPNSVYVSSTSYGTSNYPPAYKYVTASRRKSYQERIYIATYKGNIPHTGTQSSTGGGKTYMYSGNIPYVSHVQK